MKNFFFFFKATKDFLLAFLRFRFSGKAVCVFGSALVPEDSKYYQMAKTLGYELGKRKIAVITGGGPGIMAAANDGVKSGGALSLGCNIFLPHEQKENSFLDHGVTVKYFFTRKILLTRNARGFVAFPGGIGTMDELFEVLALMRTNKMTEKPLVLMGSDYWAQLLVFLKEIVDKGFAHQSDLNRIFVTDSVNEALEYLTQPMGLSKKIK